MNSIQSFLVFLLKLYGIVILVQVLLSWVPPGPNTSIAKVKYYLARLTEPVLAPVRKLMPRMGAGGLQLDLSPLIVLVVINFLLIPLVSR